MSDILPIIVAKTSTFYLSYLILILLFYCNPVKRKKEETNSKLNETRTKRAIKKKEINKYRNPLARECSLCCTNLDLMHALMTILTMVKYSGFKCMQLNANSCLNDH